MQGEADFVVEVEGDDLIAIAEDVGEAVGVGHEVPRREEGGPRKVVVWVWE